jgi:hypothetical protein
MNKLEIKNGYEIGNEIAYSNGLPLKERPLSKKKWISKESLLNLLTSKGAKSVLKELEGGEDE